MQFAVGARKLLVAGSDALTLTHPSQIPVIETLPIRAGGLMLAAPHPSGGCVMGRSASDSVVDATHRVHGYDNLFVADSSVFPTPPSVDPSFSIMAFSYVAAAEIHRRLT